MSETSETSEATVSKFEITPILPQDYEGYMDADEELAIICASHSGAQSHIDLVIKMLEKNELLDEAKLHNLIDLSKKNPKAIAKLIEESDVDPLDIDKDVPTDYQPTDYSVTDKEYNLDQVLDEIKDTDTFNRTINVLTKEWDTPSKTTISDNPEIISIVNTHMGNGVFDQVNSVLQQEKALGKLGGIADVEAYKQIVPGKSTDSDIAKFLKQKLYSFQ